MKYSIEEIDNEEIWENFSINSHPNTFLQSWNWGVFNEKIGRKIYRLGVFEGDKLLAICLLIQHKTPLGNYLYSPRGPVFNWKNLKILDLLVERAKNIAKEESCIFVKMDPLLPELEENRQIFKNRGFTPAVTFVQVEDAWLLDLGKSENELLADMRKTTRYLIRHEPEQGVKVEMSAEIEDIRKFADLLYSTASRKNFV